MRDSIYTIPITDVFEPRDGCPLCRLYDILEERCVDYIMGAAMMEPDVRIKTNEQGFCRLHYDLMFVRKNRLGMALTLESHLKELQNDIKEGAFGAPGSKPVKRIGALEQSCYVCKRIQYHFEHMAECVVYLWDADEDFGPKLRAQPYFCIPHYKKLLEYGQKRLNKKKLAQFSSEVGKVVNDYMTTLTDDVSWFCKKFDYRYDAEPWYNSKDAVERSIKFLRSDIHNK